VSRVAQVALMIFDGGGEGGGKQHGKVRAQAAGFWSRPGIPHPLFEGACIESRASRMGPQFRDAHRLGETQGKDTRKRSRALE